MPFGFAPLIAAAASPAPAAAHAQTVFSCLFGAKGVEVKRAGDAFLYRFGLPARPEIALRVSVRSGAVLQYWRVATLDMMAHLRLRSGRYSYVLYYEGLTADYARRAYPSAGVAVYEGARRVATHPCRTGRGFAPGFDYSALPEDPDPLDDLDAR
jgi:hypothetical protein